MNQFSETNPLKILVIEDNLGDFLLLKESIYSSAIPAADIQLAETLASAVEQLKQSKPDIIFLDLLLPDSRGIDSFNQLKEYVSHSAVIILSGISDTIIAREAIAQGAQDFLAKGEFDENILEKTMVYSLERKRSIESLREVNERYDLVSKATHDIIWDWDLVTGKIYRDERAVKDVYGFSSNASLLHAEDWNKQIHPDDKDRVLKTIKEIQITGMKDSFELEYRFISESGACKYIYDRGYIVRNPDGKPTRIIGAAQDVTREKEAEKKIRLSEEKYRQIFYDNPFPMFLFNIETFRILECNNATLSKYGYTREEFLQLTIQDIRPQEDIEIVKLSSTDSQWLHEAGKHVWRHIKKNGEVMMVEIFFSTIEYGGNTVRQVQVNDITEKLKLGAALEESRIQQHRAVTEATIQGQEKEREQLGIELHDNINQILATAKLYLDFAMSSSPVKKDSILKSKEFIMLATEEIRKLSHALLPSSLEEFGLIMALDELIEPLSATGNFFVDKQWNSFEENSLHKDQKLTIYRIVQEQLTNIVKHASANIVITSLRLMDDGESVELLIKDDGKGFDPSRKRNGVGLRNIISRAGLFDGNVTIHAKAGQGCELKVIFPGQQRTINKSFSPN